MGRDGMGWDMVGGKMGEQMKRKMMMMMGSPAVQWSRKGKLEGRQGWQRWRELAMAVFGGLRM